MALEVAQPAMVGLVTSRDAAEALCVSERTLWQLTQDRELLCVRIGRSVRYDLQDIQDFINQKKQGGNGG